LVEQYDSSCSPDYIANFCAYIGIPVEAFWEQVRANTNRTLFDVPATGRPVPKFRVGVGL
jgi:hypothetical protein